MKKSSVSLLGVAVLAAATGGCESGNGLLRQAGDALSLPSLYGGQEYYAARGARGGRHANSKENNPCFERPRSTPATVELGTFMQWCEAARQAEVNRGRQYIQALAQTGAAPSTVTLPANAPAPADMPITSDIVFLNQRYLESGIALSNQICEGYFQGLGLYDTGLDAAHTFVGDLGNLTSATQAATGAPARAIATGAAAFGFVGASLQNGRKHFTFDGNLQSIYYLVRSNRKNYVDAMRAATDKPTTFWRIYDWLNTYHASCSNMAVRAMIDDALSARAATTNNASTPAARVLSDAERADLAAAVRLKNPLTENQTLLAVAVSQGIASHNEMTTRHVADPDLETTGGSKVALSTYFSTPQNKVDLINFLATTGNNALAAYFLRAHTAWDQNTMDHTSGATPGNADSNNATPPASPPSPPPPPATQSAAPPGLSPN